MLNILNIQTSIRDIAKDPKKYGVLLIPISYYNSGFVDVLFIIFL